MTHENLSERELHVFKALGSGKRPSAIAHEIYLSPKTISTYRTRALEKLGMKTNHDITMYCVRNGLLGCG